MAISRVARTGVGRFRTQRFTGGRSVFATVQVFGVPEALAKLGLVYTHTYRGVGRINMRAAQKIAQLGQQNAPFRDGFLRNGIRAERQATLDWTVIASSMLGGADREYAMFQEHGTSHHPPQPFMRPAVNAVFPEVRRDLQILARELEAL